MRNSKFALRVRYLTLKVAVSAVMIELGFLIVQIFTHTGHRLFWSHYGWIAVIGVTGISIVADLIVDDSVDDRYFFDRPTEEPDFKAEVDEFARRIESGR